VSAKEWRILAESRTGTSHLARNAVCQDCCRWATFGTNRDWLAMAVSDGAGSASHSDSGAQYFCSTFVERCRETDVEPLRTRGGMLELIGSIREGVVNQSVLLGVAARELACTALVSVVGPEWAVFGQIGDGAIVLNTDSNLSVVFWPGDSEYVNCTDFLTDESFPTAFRHEFVSGAIRELAMTTDGLQRLALDYAFNLPHAPFFKPLFRALSESGSTLELEVPFREFLDSAHINERTDDDKTLVLAIRKG